MSARKFEVHTPLPEVGQYAKVGPVARCRSSVEARKVARRLALRGATSIVMLDGRTGVYAYLPGGVRLPL